MGHPLFTRDIIDMGHLLFTRGIIDMGTSALAEFHRIFIRVHVAAGQREMTRLAKPAKPAASPPVPITGGPTGKKKNMYPALSHSSCVQTVNVAVWLCVCPRGE
jgi:hypothetical protein